LVIPTSEFPTKSDEIDRTANGARFRWTLANDNAYASDPQCLSDVGSQNAKQFSASGCPENFVGSQCKFGHFWPGMWPASFA